MTEKPNLKRDQANALKDLEKFVNEPIPIVEEIEQDQLGEYTFGVKVDCENIVGLGLYDNQLPTLPESIGICPIS